MAPKISSAVKGICLDLEGVLHVGDSPVEGAHEALKELRSIAPAGIRLLTNTTSTPRKTILQRLRDMGFEVSDAELITPSSLAVSYCISHKLNPVNLLCSRSLVEDLRGLEEVGKRHGARAVILGDLGSGFTWDALNQAFRQLMEGAVLVVLQHNRYYQRPDGPVLDAGAFAAALEYASGAEPVVVGKPSPQFFRAALNGLGVAASDAVMVGDDTEADVGGALEAGIPAVQVRTGKFRAEALAESGIEPTAVIDSLADLPALLRA